MNPIPRWISYVLQYRFREGMLAFLLHRLSGLATLLFLSIHIFDTSLLYLSPSAYEEFLALYRMPVFLAGEIGLVGGVIFHGVNGLRLAIFDLALPSAWRKDRERASVWLTLAVSFILWLPAAWIMGNTLMHALSAAQ